MLSKEEQLILMMDMLCGLTDEFSRAKLAKEILLLNQEIEKIHLDKSGGINTSSSHQKAGELYAN